MSASEAADWTAFERVHGPLLVHDRIDIGLAAVAYTIAAVAPLKRRPEFRKFLPPWLRELAAEDSVRAGFESLRQMAEVPVADD